MAKIMAGRIGLVFPAYAGMNRFVIEKNDIIVSVPRIRGDEPAQREGIDFDEECSPHTRG